MDYRLKPRLFGKLPLTGDFIYQLPAEFIQTWEPCLQEGLSYTQDYFTNNWCDVYQQAPAWRFFLASGVCGTKAWVGVILASQDSVGRKFPIMVVADLPSHTDYLLFAQENITAWLAQLERLIREVLNANPYQNLESFQAALPELDIALNTTNLSDVTQSPFTPNSYYYAEGENKQCKEDFYQYLEQSLSVNQTTYCLWHTCSQNSEDYLLSSALPSKELFGALLEKCYSHWGWQAMFQDEDITLIPGLKRVNPVYKYLQKEQPLEWKSCVLTDTGKRRPINEDNYLTQDNIGLWSIADGMGGYDSGDYASEALVNALRKVPRPYKLSEFVDTVEESIFNANSHLFQYFTDLESRGGCTVVCLLCFAYYGVVIWAGDSRLYRYRYQQLEMLSRDHSQAEEAVERGEMTMEEAEQYPGSHSLTRAVGIESSLYLDMDMFAIQSGDIYLLCSDGLYKELTDKEIEQVIREHQSDWKKTADNLMQISLDRKGRDNITLIMIKIF